MLTSLNSPWHPHRKTQLALPYDAQIVRHYIPRETVDDQYLPESRALGVDGVLGSGAGVDAADPTWVAWPPALNFGGDDRVEIADAPVSLAGAFTVMAAVNIHDGSDLFDARSLAGVTNLADEYGVQIDVGCNLRYAVPASFDPNNWTVSAWFIPDFDYDDGNQHCLLDLYLGGTSRVMLFKNAGVQLAAYLVNVTDTYGVGLVKPFVAGTPVFFGVRFCGGRLSVYADTDDDGTLEVSDEVIPDPLTAGGYSLQVGAQYGSSVHLEGAVNLLITDNGGADATVCGPIFDRFNAGDGMALAGDDGWLARHGKNLVRHVGANADGSLIQSDTYSGATDMLAGTATGRVDLSTGNYLTTAGPGAGADGLTEASWGIAWDSDEVALSPALFSRWDTADNQFLISRIAAASIRVYIADAGNDAANYGTFAVAQAAGMRYKGVVTYNAGTLALHYATYDPVTGRDGAITTVAPAVTGTIPVALRDSALGYSFAYQGGDDFNGKLDDVRVWNGKALTAAEADADLINEPSPLGLSYWWPFDGDGVEAIAGLTAVWTGTPAYVDDGRHHLGRMERFLKRGQYHFPTNAHVSLGNYTGLDGATAFSMWGVATVPALDQTLGGLWDATGDRRQWVVRISAAGKFYVGLSGDGTTITAGTGSTTLAIGDKFVWWVGYDGAGASNSDRLKVGIAVYDPETGTDPTPTTETLEYTETIPAVLASFGAAVTTYIGAIDNGFGVKWWTHGLLDDWRLWVNDALDPSDLDDLTVYQERDGMASASVRPPDHWWTFDNTPNDRTYGDAEMTTVVRPAFVRADTGTQIYPDGVVRAVASGELRNKHQIAANDSSDYVVTLCERAYRNRITAALADWTENDCAITDVAVADPSGGTGAAEVTADAGNAIHRIANSPNSAIGATAGTVWIKPGTHQYARFQWWNATDLHVNYAAVNLSTGAVLASGGTTGAFCKIRLRSDGWVVFSLGGSSQTVASSSVLVILCASNGVETFDAAGTETIYVWRPTLVEQAVPPESVLAAGEATTADSLTVPLKLTTPQEGTLLAEWVVLDLPNTGIWAWPFNVGDSLAGAGQFGAYYNAASETLHVSFDNGASTTTGHFTLTGLALGDKLSLRIYWAGAAPTIRLSKNGAAEVSPSSAPSSLSLPGSWGQTRARIADRVSGGSDNGSNVGFLSLKYQSGAEKSLATMQALKTADICHYETGMQTADVDGVVTGAIQWYDGRQPEGLTLTNVEGVGRGRYLARKTFSRTSPARYYDGVDYLVRTAPAGHLRDAHYWTANDGNEYRCTNLGRAYTNLVTSDDIDGGWTSVGTPVITTGVSDPSGGTGAFRIADDDGAAAEAKWRAVTFTGDGVRPLSVVVREASMPASGVQSFDLYDTVAAANRARLTITAWVAGRPTVAMTAGTLLGQRHEGNGYWKVDFQSASVTAANAHRLYIYPASTPAQTGSIDVWRVNAYDDPIPPQDILDASAVRVADSFVDAYDAAPQAATYLVEALVADLPNQGTARTFWNLGDGAGAAAAIRLYYEAASARLVIAYHNGVSEVTGYWTVALALSDRITVRFQQLATGEIDAVGLTINGGVEDTTLDGAFGGTLALPGAWNAAEIVYAGTNATANGAVTKSVIAAGSKTTGEMQGLLENDADLLYMYVPGQYTDRGHYSLWMQNISEASAYATPTAAGTTAGLWQVFRTRLRELANMALVYTNAGANHSQGPTPGVALEMIAYGVRETTTTNRTMRPYTVVPGWGYWDDMTWAQLPLATPTVANRGVPTRVIWSTSIPGETKPYIYVALTAAEKFLGGVRNDAGTVYEAGEDTAPGIGYRTVALTWDLTTLTAYVDGVVEASTSNPAGTTTGLIEQTLGAIRLAITGHGYDDDIGDVIEWSVGLDAPDILAAHNQLKRIFKDLA